MSSQPDVQVVDVETGKLTVTSVGWRGDSLVLTLDAAVDDPTRHTDFRIVGVEPRIWWVTGMDDVTTDVRADCVVVRMPLQSGELEFTPGSY